jgi:hypothetical protein
MQFKHDCIASICAPLRKWLQQVVPTSLVRSIILLCMSLCPLCHNLKHHTSSVATFVRSLGHGQLYVILLHIVQQSRILQYRLTKG